MTDFSRIIVMRTTSNFDRPYPGSSATYNLLYANQDGFGPAFENIYHAGIKVVEGILKGWDTTFGAGVQASQLRRRYLWYTGRPSRPWTGTHAVPG